MPVALAVAQLGAQIASFFTGGSGINAGEAATEQSAAAINVQNISAYKASVLASMNNDPTAPEWLSFLANTPTNQFDVTVAQGNKAIADYKARIAAMNEATQSTIDLGTGKPGTITGDTNTTAAPGTTATVPSPTDAGIANALNNLTDVVGAAQAQAAAKPATFNWTPVVIGAVVIGALIYFKKR